MDKRKGISKKTRFEVFKRDNFTCQYCGKSVPEVTLEIDHIKPVKEGGDNNILNLITACFDCNRGKGARKLNDKSLLKIEKEKLDKLNEKRLQLEEMMKWRHELMDLEETQIDKIDNVLGDLMGIELTEIGRNNFRNLIKKHGFKTVLEATDISYNKYFNPKERNTEEVLNYIKRICVIKTKEKDDPLLKDKMYIIGILRNRFHLSQSDKNKITRYLDECCKSKNDVEGIKLLAKTIGELYEFYEELGKVFGGDL